MIGHPAYIAGNCNLGREEITRRWIIGWVSFAATIILLAVLMANRANPLWRLLLFFPATTSALCFLQAYFHFCVAYARVGLFNLGPLGQQTEVSDEGSKAKDKARGGVITTYAVLIGAIVAVVSFLV